MNKRIQELAEQAEFSVKDLHIQGDNFQKFADFLIKEVLSLVRDEVQYQIDWDLADKVTGRVNTHFGLETKNQFICPKCGVDRFKADCPNPNRIDCGIKAEAQ